MVSKFQLGVLGVAAVAALFGGGFIDLIALGATGAVAYTIGAKQKVR